MIAEKAFALGDVVFHERPLLVWPVSEEEAKALKEEEVKIDEIYPKVARAAPAAAREYAEGEEGEEEDEEDEEEEEMQEGGDKLQAIAEKIVRRVRERTKELGEREEAAAKIADVLHFLRAFRLLREELQAGVMALLDDQGEEAELLAATAALDSATISTTGNDAAGGREKMSKQLIAIAQLVAPIVPTLTLPKIAHLLRVRLFAYDFAEGRSALFRQASNMTHSCAPNVQYRFTKDEILFVCCSPAGIEIGAPITLSFLSVLDLCCSTPVRRRKIAQAKPQLAGVCNCSRCTAPDSCRMMRCPTAVATAAAKNGQPNSSNSDGEKKTCTNGFVIRSDGNSNPKPWTCRQCGETFADSDLPLARESQLDVRFQVSYVRDRHNKEVIDALIKEATIVVGPRHWLVPRLYEMRSSIYSLLAEMPSPGADVIYRQVSVGEALKFIRWHLEHVFSTCPSSGVLAALWAGKDLAYIQRERRALSFYRQYLPYMRNVYGAEDEDVLHIEKILADPSSLPEDKCEACGKSSDVTLRSCQQCLVVLYCSKECQVSHWKTHKELCLR